MNLLTSIFTVVHLVAAIAIVVLVLLQQGKGADMGASFGGGGSQTLFGPAGGGNALTRMTAILAALFFVTSFGLAIIAKDKTELGSAEGSLSEIAEQIEAQNAEAEAAAAALEDIPESIPETLPGEADDFGLPGDLPE